MVGGLADNEQAGAVWLFVRKGTLWSQQGKKLVGNGSVGNAIQGFGALSSDGKTGMVGGYKDNNQTGATWIYKLKDSTWFQVGNKLVGTSDDDSTSQGISVTLSQDGNTAVIGGPYDNNSKGAVWIFKNSPSLYSSKALAMPAVITPGDSINITFQIQNNGSNNTHSCFIRFILSKDSVYNNPDILLSDGIPLPDLLPGAMSDVKGKYKIPDNAALGDYYILIVLDLNNEELKFNSSNLLAFTPLVIGGSGVTVSNYTAGPDSLYPGDYVNVLATIKNFGQADSKPCNYQYLLSSDEYTDGKDVALTEPFALPFLHADDAFVIRSTKVGISADLAAGNYNLFLQLIGCNGNDNKPETKNPAGVPLKILSFPDIQITSPLLNTSVIYPGDSIFVSCKLQNVGEGNMMVSGSLKYFLSVDTVWDASDLALGNYVVDPIPPAQSLNIPASKYKIPGTTKNGKYNVLLVFDQNNAIRESNKVNNQITLLLSINLRPIITGIILPKFVQVNQSATIQIKLNSLVPLKSLVFSYTRITDSTSRKDSMILTMSNYKDSIFTIITPKNIMDEIGFEYSFLATDSSGNKSFLFTGSIHIYWPAPGIAIPYSSFGTETFNYRTIAVPLDLIDDNIDSTFNKNLGSYDKKKWRFFNYRNGSNIEYKNGLNEIETGQGYWLISKFNPGTPIFSGAGTTVNATIASPFTLPLIKGWNQIGNPYNFSLSWDDIKRFNKNDSILLSWKKFAGNWTNDDKLQPLEGAFILANGATLLQFPTQKKLISQRLGLEDNSSSMNTENWLVPIKLQSEDNIYNLGGLGMNTNANISIDALDDFTPPQVGDWLELNFYHPEFFYPKFTKDIVPFSEQYTWEFKIESTKKSSKILSWDNSFFSKSYKKLILYDQELERKVDMGIQTSYAFESGEAKNFKVYYGSPEYLENNMLPETMRVGNPYPNPVQLGTSLSVSLPREKEKYLVRLEVYNMLGQKTVDVIDGLFGEGFYDFKWEASDLNGEKLPSGFYNLKLTIAGNNLIKTFNRKVVLQ